MGRMTTQFTPEEIIRLRQHFTDKEVDKFKNMLLNLGFEFFSSGCFKCVYRHKDYKFVIKVGNVKHIKQEFSASVALPERYVAKPLAYYKDVFVQQFVRGDRCKGIGCKPPFKIGDWHGGNHFHNPKTGKPIVFDLGYK